MSKKKNTNISAETAASCHALGVKLYLEKIFPAAIAALEKAINLDPSCHQAFALAGQIFLDMGQSEQAVDCYACAIRAAPGRAEYKEKLVPLLEFFRFGGFSPDMQAVIGECLRVHGVDHQKMQQAWASLLMLDPAFKPLYAAADEKNYSGFKKSFAAAPSHAALVSEYFLEGLQKILVFDLQFERFLTWLRRFLLEEIDGQARRLFGARLETLAAALAIYCEHTEYIFDVSAGEKETIDALERQLNEDAGAKEPAVIAVYGCYRLLHGLDSAAEIEKRLLSLPDLARVQIRDYAALEKIRETIPAITDIEDWISNVVRDQYEEFPYPRWHEINKEIRSEASEGHLRGKKAKILVAGCGTGVEAVELATVFPDSTVLAVDLSLSSLSYAIKKAGEYKLKNLTFGQADILGLHALGERFDYIASSGVLHHMDDPFKGWSVLSGLLKPRGLMRIALYSSKARESITQARKIIEDKGYGHSAEDIRKFRRDADKILRGKTFADIIKMRDYFIMPECRDLLFHVQEHCFDIPQIQSCLDKLGLEFLEFYIGHEVLKKYSQKYPSDLGRTNLQNWHNFEQKNPDTFIGMYRFWCRKKS